MVKALHILIFQSCFYIHSLMHSICIVHALNPGDYAKFWEYRVECYSSCIRSSKSHGSFIEVNNRDCSIWERQEGEKRLHSPG